MMKMGSRATAIYSPPHCMLVWLSQHRSNVIFFLPNQGKQLLRIPNSVWLRQLVSKHVDAAVPGCAVVLIKAE